jgi:formylmethanofuran--tetrahydromethanopterin N-formyltransferase
MQDLGRVEVADIFCEAFDELYSRFIITAERGLTIEDTMSPFLEYDPLRFAAYRSTSTPAVVVGRTEAGIEKWLSENETPDGRQGVVVQCWGAYDKEKPLEEQVTRFNKEMSLRIRQDILSASGGTTRIFDWPEPGKKPIYVIDNRERVGDCGGGDEKFLDECGRKNINIPLMIGHDFKIDETMKCGIGISGANLQLYCDSVDAGRRAGRASIEAIKKVEGVITPFYICPSGSTTGSYKKIGPPTNRKKCPNLRGIIPNSEVPEDVNSIPEIVVDGISLKAVENALREGIKAASYVDGVKLISAGSYEGNLGQHKIYLRELFR